MIYTFLILHASCIILVIYPYLIYPHILKHMKTRRVKMSRGHSTSMTLVFCAYNEEASLPEKIENIAHLKARHPDLEVLAYDDKSTDGTLALLQKRADLIRVIEGPGRTGKAHGMKLLAQQASGEIIIFTDANVILDEKAIDNLQAYYADSNVGGVCGSLHYVGDNVSKTAAVGSAYWRLEEYIKSEESRTGSVMGADGSIFSLRRALYPTFPDSVLDDMTVSMAAVFAGKRLVKANDVIAYERVVANRSEEISRKIRISIRAYHTHLFLRPQLRKMSLQNKFKYASHKYLRWFGGGFLLTSALSLVLALLCVSPWLSIIALTMGAILSTIGLITKTTKLTSVMEIIIALIATQWGVILAMRGHTQTTWNPAASR